jgi:plastocyanin
MTVPTTSITSTTPNNDQSDPELRSADRTSSWDRLLMVSAGLVAAVDLIFFALIAEIIPPLAVGIVLTVIGVALMRVRRTPGIIVLALTTAVMLAGSAPFAVDHIGHPESGVDWMHAVIGVFGRLFVLGVAVKTWRAGSDAAARTTGVLALGVLGALATVALVATAATSGDERRDGDVTLSIDATAFPEQIVVESGDVLFIDNSHIFRHSFTVVGTDIDVQLPALQAVRVPIDLPTGTYEVFCDVPGHESMTSVLVVE